MDTREAIRAEFMRLYAHERLDRITVKGLCAAMPVARTTFYAHYRNVDDVLAEVEDGLLAGLADVTERISGGGYAAKSWQEQITSGIAADKQQQKKSLAWIREQSLDPMCVESLANHDPGIEPHVIEL